MCSSKDIVKKIEMQAAVLEKIFANYTADNDLNSKICKTFRNKNVNIQKKRHRQQISTQK